MPPGEARQLGIDVAEALAAAHQAGLAHLCLQPEHVLRTTHGQVKVGGLAVDAAVRGVECAGDADAARRDTWGAAAIVYAALTARWPGGAGTGLAAAPHDGAALCSPRQVRAGVPHDLDSITLPGAGHPRAQDRPAARPRPGWPGRWTTSRSPAGSRSCAGRRTTSRPRRRTSPRTSRRTTTRPAGRAAAPRCWPGPPSRWSWWSASRWPAGSS